MRAVTPGPTKKSLKFDNGPPPEIVSADAGPSTSSGPDVLSSASVPAKVMVWGEEKTAGENWISLPSTLGSLLASPMTYGNVPESPEPDVPLPVEMPWPGDARQNSFVVGFSTHAVEPQPASHCAGS